MHEDRAALEYATEGLAIAQTHDLFKDSIDNLAVSQKIHAALGDYESALGSSQQYAAMRDSMASNGIATEMMELDLRQQEVKDSLEREELRSHEKAIRALDGAVSRIPIIAMTANTMQADLDQCKAAGMDGYIPKPFKCEELIFALQHALIPERSVRP